MSRKKVSPSDFRSLAPSVPAAQISGFLEYSGWDLVEQRDGLLEYWRDPVAHRPEEGHVYFLPLNSTMRDYDRRFREFLAELADHFGDTPSQLIRRINEISWDRLLFRMTHVEHDESAGLFRASETLSAGMKMLELSALYTANPRRRSWGGNRSALVRYYLAEDVRLAHTERGSFVFPILSRIRQDSGPDTPFGREVVTNLSRALERISQWPEEERAPGEETLAFDAALARALSPLGHLGQLESLTISFQWAPVHGLPQHVPRHSLDFSTPRIQAISTLAQSPSMPSFDIPGIVHAPGRRTVTATRAVPSRSRVSGPVIAWGMDDRNRERGESSTFVFLRTSFGDVRMTVSEEEYDFALQAREDGRAVTAVGRLVERDGVSTLVGHIDRGGSKFLSKSPGS
ncbi:hypothetical protein [Streptomyces sp. SID14515]|uniref:hypothetical protein n=1 Tax=Streptomyces sp. SID14515 TaxID=2706074 RepID=UPI0013C63DB8|nr:hypothetical protein [Streptomyces sp. SID14515]NEB39505.1 hypothetical protein [Streptomyces sp. SID14515]